MFCDSGDRDRSTLKTLVQSAFLLPLLFSLTWPALGESAGARKAVALEAAPGASLELDGDSSLHRFSAKANGIHVSIELDTARVEAAPNPLDVDALIKGRYVRAFELIVPVGGLASNEKKLDANMGAALKGDQFKEIRFRMDSYEAASSIAGAPLTLTVHGRLRVAGVERKIDIVATGVRAPNGVRITGSKDLLMTDYHIKPPTMMLGAVRTKNLVTVKFNVTLQLI